MSILYYGIWLIQRLRGRKSGFRRTKKYLYFRKMHLAGSAYRHHYPERGCRTPNSCDRRRLAILDAWRGTTKCDDHGFSAEERERPSPSPTTRRYPRRPPAETKPHAEHSIGIPGKTISLFAQKSVRSRTPLPSLPGTSQPYPRRPHEPRPDMVAANLNHQVDPDYYRPKPRPLAHPRAHPPVGHILLPSLVPEQILRHEFVYDGMVHDNCVLEKN